MEIESIKKELRKEFDNRFGVIELALSKIEELVSANSEYNFIEEFIARGFF